MHEEQAKGHMACYMWHNSNKNIQIAYIVAPCARNAYKNQTTSVKCKEHGLCGTDAQKILHYFMQFNHIIVNISGGQFLTLELPNLGNQ